MSTRDVATVGKEAATRGGGAFLEFAVHLALIAALTGGMFLLEKWLHVLWGREKLFFNIVPLGWVFDFFDLALIVGLSGWGAVTVFLKYRGT